MSPSLEHVTGSVAGDATDVIDVVLEGGPANLPNELRALRVSSVDDKVKIPHYGGYEHFECDRSRAGDGVPVVFRWTGRTRVAE